jgi:hypothetical protein
MDIRYATSLISRLRLKEWSLFALKLSVWVVNTWCSMAHEQKRLRRKNSLCEEEIISDLISDNLSDVPG